MKSENFFQKFKDRTFDYVHIDGDHSYQGVKLDFKMFWPKVTSGGFLAIHDIGSPDKDGNVYGTRRFWTELKKERKAFWEIMENPGLGVIQK